MENELLLSAGKANGRLIGLYGESDFTDSLWQCSIELKMWLWW